MTLIRPAIVLAYTLTLGLGVVVHAEQPAEEQASKAAELFEKTGKKDGTPAIEALSNTGDPSAQPPAVFEAAPAKGQNPPPPPASNGPKTSGIIGGFLGGAAAAALLFSNSLSWLAGYSQAEPTYADSLRFLLTVAAIAAPTYLSYGARWGRNIANSFFSSGPKPEKPTETPGSGEKAGQALGKGLGSILGGISGAAAGLTLAFGLAGGPLAGFFGALDLLVLLVFPLYLLGALGLGGMAGIFNGLHGGGKLGAWLGKKFDKK